MYSEYCLYESWFQAVDILIARGRPNFVDIGVAEGFFTKLVDEETGAAMYVRNPAGTTDYRAYLIGHILRGRITHSDRYAHVAMMRSQITRSDLLKRSVPRYEDEEDLKWRVVGRSHSWDIAVTSMAHFLAALLLR